MNFFAFDIAIIGKTCRKGKVTPEHVYTRATTGVLSLTEYLCYKTAMEVLEQSGLQYLKPLCQGSLQDMTSYPLGFPSTIPQLLGLPPLQDNPAEGVVIKPMEEAICLSTNKGQRRVIMKRKIDKFAERRTVKHSVEDGQGAGYHHTVGDQQLLNYEIMALMTEQRVTNVISKLGWPTEEGWREVVRVMVEEVREELEEDCPELLVCCGEEELKDTLLKECTLLWEGYKDSH